MLLDAYLSWTMCSQCYNIWQWQLDDMIRMRWFKTAVGFSILLNLFNKIALENRLFFIATLLAYKYALFRPVLYLDVYQFVTHFWHIFLVNGSMFAPPLSINRVSIRHYTAFHWARFDVPIVSLGRANKPHWHHAHRSQPWLCHLKHEMGGLFAR